VNEVSDLAFFVQLVRCGSLAATAQVFDVTPPAVSRRLSQLEKRLGVRLLNRTTRRLAPTPEGERYLAEGTRILEDLVALEEELTGSQSEPRGILRINASFGFGRRVVVRLMSEFRKRHPKVELQLQLTDHVPSLTEAGFDVAFRFGEPPDARLIAHQLLTNHRVLCAAPAYLAAHPAILAPADLARHACLLVRENKENASLWHLIERSSGKEARVKVGGPLASNDGESVVRWAIDGHGVILRSLWDISPELASGQLLQVLPAWSSTAADIHLLVPQRMNTSAKVRSFVAFCREWFAGEIDWTKKT
jgi:DNA-binding transcriptional LysR family regulator